MSGRPVRVAVLLRKPASSLRAACEKRLAEQEQRAPGRRSGGARAPAAAAAAALPGENATAVALRHLLGLRRWHHQWREEARRRPAQILVLRYEEMMSSSSREHALQRALAFWGVSRALFVEFSNERLRYVHRHTPSAPRSPTARQRRRPPWSALSGPHWVQWQRRRRRSRRDLRRRCP